MFCDIHSFFGKVHKNSLCFTREISHKLCSQFMKIMLLYILYCPPPPQHDGSLIIPPPPPQTCWNPLGPVGTRWDPFEPVGTIKRGFHPFSSSILFISCSAIFCQPTQCVCVYCEHNLCDISLVKHSEFL